MMNANLAKFGKLLTQWVVVPVVECPARDSDPFIDLQALEERVLYSAGPIPVDADLIVGHEPTDFDNPHWLDAISAELEHSITGVDSHPSINESDWDPSINESDWDPETTLGADTLEPTSNERPIELIIVDTSVTGHQQLIDGLLSQKSQERIFEVVYLTRGSDGIAEISAALVSNTSVNAIHIVSHGSDGELRLGETILNRDSLHEFEEAFAGWRESLTTEADILIYGCNIAESADGESFVREFSELLEADVSASDDLTGNSELGGDWDFEFTVGDNTTEIAFQASTLESWGYVLAKGGGGPGGGNAEPTGQDITITMLEDTAHLIGLADIGYQDDDTPLSQISINALPSAGLLLLNGVQVEVADTISRLEIDEGHLVFLPESNEIGTTSFAFTVNDGTLDALTSNTMTFTVSPDADASPVTVGDSLFSLTGGLIVNDTLVGQQGSHRVVGLENGGYVVVWQNESNSKIYQQYFDADGQASGEEQIASGGSGNQTEPDVAALADGGYVITWTYDNGLDRDVYVKRFDQEGNQTQLSGVSSGGVTPTLVSQNSVSEQFESKVTALSDGGFAVAWATLDATDGDGVDIAARVFDAQGGASDEYRINTDTAGAQRSVSIEGTSNNGLIVGWVDQSINDYDLKGKLFEGGDLANGTDLSFNLTTANRQRALEITSLSNGNFLAIWESHGGQDGQGKGVFGAVFDEFGNRLSASDVLMTQNTTGHQNSPSAIALNDGGFVAFWESGNEDVNGTAIVGRRFDASGTPSADAFLVNSHHHGDQTAPAVAMLNNGQIIVAWGEADGDNQGVDNADATNDFESGIYLDRFEWATQATEGVPVPFAINAIPLDPSESYVSIIISDIPSGAVITDGGANASNLGDATVNITGWDLANLNIVLAENDHLDFALDIETRTADGASTVTANQTVHIVVENADSPLSKPDLLTATNEDSTTSLTLNTLTSGVVDLDVAADPVSPDSSFTSESYPPSVNGSNQLIWENSEGNKDIKLDADHVSFDANSGSEFAPLEGAFVFDGIAGGVIDKGAFDFKHEGGIELWIRPDSISNNAIILDFGDDEDGIAIYQQGDQLLMKVNNERKIAGQTTEPYLLMGSGLTTTEFTHIFINFSGKNTQIGAEKMTDIQLYINGSLADQFIDIPTFANDSDWANGNDIGLGQANGDVVDASFANYTGAMGHLNLFDKFATAQDVETRYLNVINSVDSVTVTTFEGQTFTPGNSVSLGSGAILTANAGGSLTYDPNGSFESLAVGETTQDSFSYTISNGAGASTVDVIVDITGANDAPIIGGLSPVITNEDVTLTDSLVGFVTDVDISDSANHSYSVITQPANGSVVIDSNGSYQYTPNLNFAGTDSFVFQVDDGNGGTDTGTLLINILPVNDAPNANSDSYTVLEDETLTAVQGTNDLLQNDSDIEGDALAVSLTPVSGPSNGTLTLRNDGTFDYVPDLNFYGTDSFVYEVSDSTSTSTATVNITVVPVNDDPTITNSARIFVNENQTNVVIITSTDPESDRTSYSLTGAGLDDGFFRLNASSGRLTFVNSANFENPLDNNGDNTYEIEVRVDDVNGGSSTSTLQIEVVNVNESPVAVNDAYGVDEGSSFSVDVTLNDSDPENDPISVILVNAPEHGTVSIDGTGNVVYRHDGSETIFDRFTYVIADDSGLTDSGTVTVSINPVDDAPYAVNDTIVVAYDESIEISPNLILKNDSDADNLNSEMSVVIVSQPSNGTIAFVNGMVVFSPVEDFVGIDSFQYRVEVNGLTSNLATVSLNVVTGFGGNTPAEESVEAPVEEEPNDPLEDVTTPEPGGAGKTDNDQGGEAEPEFAPVPSSASNELAFTAGSDYATRENSLEFSDFNLKSTSSTYAYTNRSENLSIANLAREVSLSSSLIERSEFESSLMAGLLWNDLDSAKREFMVEPNPIGVQEIVASAASFAAIGYFWIIRGGVLLTTLMSSAPAYTSFDVGSLIESASGSKDESIEQMVDN